MADDTPPSLEVEIAKPAYPAHAPHVANISTGPRYDGMTAKVVARMHDLDDVDNRAIRVGGSRCAYVDVVIPQHGADHANGLVLRLHGRQAIQELRWLLDEAERHFAPVFAQEDLFPPDQWGEAGR